MQWVRDKLSLISLLQVIKKISNLAIDFLLPPRCFMCKDLLLQINYLCGSCFQKLQLVTEPYCQICGFMFEFAIPGKLLCAKCVSAPPSYDYARAIFKFNEASKKLVHNFKYQDQTFYANFFAAMLIARHQKLLSEADIIAPVPMHRLKRIIRRYNPPQILAKALHTRQQHLSLIIDLLIKTKWTKPQTQLTKAQRQKNLQNSIQVNSKYNLKGQRIVLIDDVKTTGTTISLCAKLLKKHGAKAVIVLTIAAT